MNNRLIILDIKIAKNFKNLNFKFEDKFLSNIL